MRPRPARRHAAVALLLALLGCECGGGGDLLQEPVSDVPRGVLEPIVARDVEPFPADGLPATTDALLAGARLVVFGETHYLEEHQRFLVRLLPRLHAAGVRVLLQEQMHAAAWAGDEYARLRSDTLPMDVAAFDRILLDGLRTFNAGRPDGERIGFRGFDANHWVGLFSTHARDFQDRFGPVEALGEVLASTPDSATYQAALAALPATLAAQASQLEATLGAEHHALLVELVAVEQRSLVWRRTQDGVVREGIIRDQLLAALSTAQGAPVAVNTGMWHAQRAQQLPPALQPVVAWLVANPEASRLAPSELRTIACTAARGQALDAFNAPAAFAFDVLGGRDNDLTRLLAERALDQAALLPLGDPIFSDARLSFTVTRHVDLVQPGRAWDALLLYPTATVLASLAPYR